MNLISDVKTFFFIVFAIYTITARNIRNPRSSENCTDYCRNNGTCLDESGCHCISDDNCEYENTECLMRSTVCLNEATCVTEHGSYKCKCQSGWSGDDCGENIDDCVDDPCVNGGTCVDLVSGFSCMCPPGKRGLFCHLDDGCGSNPCHSDATCENSKTDGTFKCLCTTGYKGDDCKEDIDECESSPCRYGKCVNFPGFFICHCPPGYRGALCEVKSYQ